MNVYPAVLIHKQNYEGDNVFNFDLVELIMIVYSKEGKILSSKSITKDNGAWISETHINSSETRVLQIRLLEFKKPEMTCEISSKVYEISREGKINSAETKDIRKGVVLWDKALQDFRLKE